MLPSTPARQGEGQHEEGWELGGKNPRHHAALVFTGQQAEEGCGDKEPLQPPASPWNSGLPPAPPERRKGLRTLHLHFYSWPHLPCLLILMLLGWFLGLLSTC